MRDDPKERTLVPDDVDAEADAIEVPQGETLSEPMAEPQGDADECDRTGTTTTTTTTAAPE